MSVLDRAVAMQKAPLFAELGADALLPLASLSEELSLRAGDVLFEAGEIGDALYIIVTGTLRVERGGVILAHLGVGECVGEMAVLDWEARSATVVATEPTRLIRVDRNDLMDTLADHPPLVQSLARVLIRRIRGA